MSDICHYVRADGTYYGQSDETPEGCVAVGTSPTSADQVWNGTEWITPPPILNDLRAAAKRRVDEAAEAYRLTYITAGSGQAIAYTQKLDEARAYLANTSLTAGECPHIFAEVGITGETAEAVARVVVGMHAAWQVTSAEIERKRLTAKAAIEVAETADAINAAAAIDWDA